MSSLPQPKKYKVIYVDPPWRYEVYSRDTGLGRSAESHYGTMQLDDLKSLPVKNFMDDDCAVLMWVTWPVLPQALDLAAAWGLKYSTCGFLWAKVNPGAQKKAQRVLELIKAARTDPKALRQLLRIRDNNLIIDPCDNRNWFMAMGFSTRANTEPCLLFTRGNPKRKSKGVRQFVADIRRAHSQKPDSIYGYIEQLYDGPYCELFSRRKREGWDCYGNEIDGRDMRDVLTAHLPQQTSMFPELFEEEKASAA